MNLATTTLQASRQAQAIAAINFFAPLATNLVTPLTTYYSLQQSQNPLSPHEKTLLFRQEIARQLVSAASHLVFNGLGFVAGLLAMRKQDAMTRTLAGTIGSVASSFIGYAFVRPIVLSDVTVRLVTYLNRKDQAKLAKQALQSKPPMPTAMPFGRDAMHASPQGYLPYSAYSQALQAYRLKAISAQHAPLAL